MKTVLNKFKKNKSRYIKMFGAFLCLGFSGYSFYPQVMNITSERAVLNAWTVSVAAPIDGTLEGLCYTRGAHVKAGQELGFITNTTLDRSRYFEAEKELAENKSKLSHYIKKKQMISERLKTLELEQTNWLNARRLFLSDNLLKAKSAAARDRREFDYCKTEYERTKKLYAQGCVSKSRLESAENDFKQSIEIQKMNESEIKMIEINLESLKSGFDVSSTYDRSNTRLLIDELLNELAEVESKYLYHQTLNEALESNRNHLKEMVVRQGRAAITSPVNGQIWHAFEYNSRDIRRGEGILQVARTDDLFITAIFDQRYMDNVSVGSKARVELKNGEKNISGRIVRISGFERTQIPLPSASAIELELEDEKQFELTVKLDSPLKNTEIGTFARVYIKLI